MLVSGAVNLFSPGIGAGGSVSQLPPPKRRRVKRKKRRSRLSASSREISAVAVNEFITYRADKIIRAQRLQSQKASGCFVQRERRAQQGGDDHFGKFMESG